MRKLVYDCYFEDTLVKTTSSYADAVEWAGQDRRNSYKDKLIKYEQKHETKEQKEKRLAQIESRQIKIREKKEQKKAIK